MVALFGREAALALLDGARREASAGSGRLVLITGEAGIGKSTLAQEAVRPAQETGTPVARGFAVDDPGAPALWPWRRVGRDVPEIAAALDTITPDEPDDAARFRLGEAVSTAVARAAADNGLLLIIEDAHWADGVSLSVLKSVALDVVSTRALIVVTARDLPGTSYASVHSDLVRMAGTVPVPLSGLPVESVTHWLRAAAVADGWLPHVADVVARTGGNPFYIRTVTAQPPPGPGSVALDRSLADRSGVRDLLVSPLASLPTEARRTVETAALVGERLSPALLAAARGRPVERISEHLAAAVRAGILTFGSTGLAFRHAIVRDAIAAQVPDERRAATHAGIARALDETGEPSLVGAAAGHWDRAGGPDAAATCRDRAGRAAAIAARELAHDRAVELARMQMRHSASLGESAPVRAAETVQLARDEWAAGLLPAALDSCRRAAELAEAGDRPDLLAEAALVPQGVGSVDVSRFAVGLVHRALDRLPPGDSALRARLLGQLAVAAADEAADSSAGPLSAQALAMARRIADPRAELETIAARHFALCYPQAVAERAGLARRALELADAAPMGRLWGLLWSADIALQRGDLDQWDTLTQDIEALAGRTGSPVARWHVRRMRAVRLAQSGEFAAAIDQAVEGRRIAERVGDLSMIGMYYAFRVQLALVRGLPEDLPLEAMAMLDRAPAMPLITTSRAQIALLTGRRQVAEALVAGLADLPDRMPLGPRWMGSIGTLGELSVDLGQAELAARCYRVLAPQAGWFWGDGGGTPFAGGSVELPMGRLARAAGRPEAALAHFRRAVEADTRIGARPFTALARLRAAECLADLGSAPAEAAGLATAARAEFDALGMPGPAAAAARVLDRLPPVTAENPLTAREAEIAVLEADGLSNKDIAGRLFLSVRTVESHVRSALGKLQLTTRTELAIWVHRRQRP
ncbi:ATP-binding protein [Nakamurella sp.]|uniref:ATP-binding protein n=1 Tax=Nakamurella sp. TaxID=1869182 RepID=UPI003B3B8A2B